MLTETEESETRRVYKHALTARQEAWTARNLAFERRSEIAAALCCSNTRLLRDGTRVSAHDLVESEAALAQAEVVLATAEKNEAAALRADCGLPP
jgi:hypothetical protein